MAGRVIPSTEQALDSVLQWRADEEVTRPTGGGAGALGQFLHGPSLHGLLGKVGSEW